MGRNEYQEICEKHRNFFSFSNAVNNAAVATSFFSVCLMLFLAPVMLLGLLFPPSQSPVGDLSAFISVVLGGFEIFTFGTAILLGTLSGMCFLIIRRWQDRYLYNKPTAH